MDYTAIAGFARVLLGRNALGREEIYNDLKPGNEAASAIGNRGRGHRSLGPRWQVLRSPCL